MIGSFLLGVLALTALDAVLSSPAAAARTGGLVSFPAKAFRRIADPTIPLIPNYKDTSPSPGQDGIGGK